MSRNFELMTQLGLRVGVTDKPKPDAADRVTAVDDVPVLFSNDGDASGEEMVRFIRDMFPRGGSAPQE
jgi:hypothetical protein